MKIISNVGQGSDEWHQLRLGIITASRFNDVLSGGRGLTRLAYMRELAAEILTGESASFYQNDAMKWGTETEPQARAFYGLMRCVDVDEVAFIKHDSMSVGVSPDGLVGANGLVEFKCPKTSTQIETFLSGDMPKKHIPQVQGQMWVSEREWCDFVSFDPRINGISSYFIKRIHRDDDYINKLEKAVVLFLKELKEMTDKLQ